MVASAPNRASSARTAGRCRSCSIDGNQSEIRHCRMQIADCRLQIRSHRSICNLQSEICNSGAMLALHRHDVRSTEIPSARAVLAVCRAAGAADGRGARRARSRSARGALRRAAAAVLDHAGVSGARGARLRPRARAGARRRPNSARPARAPRRRYRARFWSSDARAAARSVSRSSARSDATEVLIDDRPVPYARELWLPLVWFLHSPVDDRGRPSDRIERDLQRLEAELKQLEAEYNMFFSGRLPKPPWETRGRVEALVKQYDRAHIQNYGDRFRFRRCSRGIADVHRSVGSRPARARGRPAGSVRAAARPTGPPRTEAAGGSHPPRRVVPRSGARDGQAHTICTSRSSKRAAKSARRRCRSTSSPSS